MAPSIRSALFRASSTWSLDESLLWTIIPRSFSLSICPSSWPSIWYVCWLTIFPVCMTLHLLKLNFICQSSDHLNNVFKSDWKISLSWHPSITLTTLISSANFSTLLFISLSIELTNIIKSNGPKTEPWGTPLMTSFHSDLHPFKITLCWRPDSHSSIQLSNVPLIPWALSCISSLLWGTLSNALLKSRYATSSCLPWSKLSDATFKNSKRFV